LSPEITTAMAAISLIDKMGGWSVGGICVFIGITPAVFVYLSARMLVRTINSLRIQMAANEKESAQRFQTFQVEYDNNIKFVKDYSDLANRLEDTLRRNTIAMTKLIDRIDTIRISK